MNSAGFGGVKTIEPAAFFCRDDHSNLVICEDKTMPAKVEEALAGYRKIKKESPAHVSISEQRLNTLGTPWCGRRRSPKRSPSSNSTPNFIPRVGTRTTVWAKHT